MPPIIYRFFCFMTHILCTAFSGHFISDFGIPRLGSLDSGPLPVLVGSRSRFSLIE